MWTWLSRISVVLIGLFVAAGLAFGATQAFGSGMAMTCGDDPGEIGTCPPFTQSTCNEACEDMFDGNPGACLAGCCVCTV